LGFTHTLSPRRDTYTTHPEEETTHTHTCQKPLLEGVYTIGGNRRIFSDVVRRIFIGLLIIKFGWNIRRWKKDFL